MAGYELIVHRALRLHNLLYHIHSKFSPSVLIWNSDKNELEINNLPLMAKPFKFHVWYFNVFVVCGVILFGSCLDVIFHYNDAEVNPVLLILALLLAVLPVLVWGSVCAIVKPNTESPDSGSCRICIKDYVRNDKIYVNICRRNIIYTKPFYLKYILRHVCP